jgi:hypothetical protein
MTGRWWMLNWEGFVRGSFNIQSQHLLQIPTVVSELIFEPETSGLQIRSDNQFTSMFGGKQWLHNGNSGEAATVSVHLLPSGNVSARWCWLGRATWCPVSQETHWNHYKSQQAPDCQCPGYRLWPLHSAVNMQKKEPLCIPCTDRHTLEVPQQQALNLSVSHRNRSEALKSGGQETDKTYVRSTTDPHRQWMFGLKQADKIIAVSG